MSYVYISIKYSAYFNSMDRKSLLVFANNTRIYKDQNLDPHFMFSNFCILFL